MTVRLLLLVLSLILMTGCGTRFGSSPESSPTLPPPPVPTFTPTPVMAEAAPPEVPSEVPATVVAEEPALSNADVLADQPNLILAPTPTPKDGQADQVADEMQESASAAPAETLLTIAGEIVNIRRGPSIEYVVLESAVAGQQFPVTGRNAAGDWWQVCCFGNDEPGWLFAPLVEVVNDGNVRVATDIPAAPTATAAPIAVEQASEEATPADAPPPQEVAPVVDAGTAGNFDPGAQFHIVGHRVLGYDENNGGIFNNGGQHMIFVNVIDENGQGIDGAVVRDAVGDKVDIVTGPKGPGRAEYEMFGNPLKLYVASIPSGPVTSQISNQMDTVYPHLPDIIGRLGPPEEEYAICPTAEDRCEPPFYHAHWSYEITFQKIN